MERTTGIWVESMRRLLQIGAVGGVLIAVAMMVAAIRDGSFSTPLSLTAPATAADTLLSSMPAGLEYDTVTVHAVSTADRGLLIAVSAADATLYVLGAAILWQKLLSKVFWEAGNGHPFAAIKVTRIRSAAWLTLALAALAFYAKPLVLAWASSQIGDGSWSVSASFVPFFLVVVAFRTGPDLAARRGTGRPRRAHGLMPGDADSGDIVVYLDDVLQQRGMTLTGLAQAIGIALANASNPQDRQGAGHPVPARSRPSVRSWIASLAICSSTSREAPLRCTSGLPRAEFGIHEFHPDNRTVNFWRFPWARPGHRRTGTFSNDGTDSLTLSPNSMFHYLALCNNLFVSR